MIVRFCLLNNIMLLTKSLEEMFKALQSLFPKMKKKTEFTLNCLLLILITRPSTCNPFLTTSPFKSNLNSFLNSDILRKVQKKVFNIFKLNLGII